MAPLVRGRKGEFKDELAKLAQHGFVRARIDGELRHLDEELDEIHLDKRKNHTIEVVIDRLLVKPGIEKRLEQSVATAMKLGKGLVLVAIVNGEEHLYSARMACPDCGTLGLITRKQLAGLLPVICGSDHCSMQFFINDNDIVIRKPS